MGSVRLHWAGLDSFGLVCFRLGGISLGCFRFVLFRFGWLGWVVLCLAGYGRVPFAHHRTTLSHMILIIDTVYHTIC